MKPMYYIGLDVHKRKISYCIKDTGGMVYAEGSLPASRIDLDRWMKTLPQPWSAAMEATMFTGWETWGQETWGQTGRFNLLRIKVVSPASRRGGEHATSCFGGSPRRPLSS